MGETADTPIYYTYDQVSNLLTSDDTLGGLGISTHAYDKLDRVTSKTTVAGTVAYEYDLSGMKTKVTDPNTETTETHFDAAGRMVRATVVGSPNRENYFHYDTSGLLERRILSGNGVMTYHTYDVAGRLKELANLDSSAAVLTYFAYQRNQNGAITRINHEANEWTYFTFDALDRLTEELRVKNPTLYGFLYDYDAASNRIQKTNLVSDVATDYTINSRNLIASEVTSGVTTAYEYDQSQRMKTRYSPTLATYFSHNERGLPTKIEFAVSGGSPDTTQEMKYTGTGERAVLVSEFGTTLLAYDGTKLLTERAGGGFSFGEYRWAGGQQIEQFDGELSATLKPVMNQDGSVEKIAGLSGRVIYDRFGVELVASLPGTTRTRFMTPTLLKLSPSSLEILLGRRGCYLAGLDVLTAFGFGGLWLSPSDNGELPFTPHPRSRLPHRRGRRWHGGHHPDDLPDDLGQPENEDDPRDEPPPVVTGEEIDEPGIRIQVKFFSTTDENTEKRLGRDGKDLWLNAIGDWIREINDHCGPRVVLGGPDVLPDDVTTLTSSDGRLEEFKAPQGKRGWTAKQRRLDKFIANAPIPGPGLNAWNWVTGYQELLRFIRSPGRTTFHIGLFDEVWRTANELAIGLVTELGGPVSTPGPTAAYDWNAHGRGPVAMKHETGHLFGLPDEDLAVVPRNVPNRLDIQRRLREKQGVMAKGTSSGHPIWGRAPWQPDYCGIIALYFGV